MQHFTNINTGSNLQQRLCPASQQDELDTHGMRQVNRKNHLHDRGIGKISDDPTHQSASDTNNYTQPSRTLQVSKMWHI